MNILCNYYKVSKQEDELMKMRDSLNQFENKHIEMERQYKQEINKLRMELDNGGMNMNTDMRPRNRFNENIPPPNLNNNRDGKFFLFYFILFFLYFCHFYY